eukprot:Skav211728  [mRNA]  locus=scaffold1682:32211:36268:+ [translate_table: standard]
MVTSDHAENVVKLSKCAFYKQADYSTHLLTYTFMNVGASAAFTVQDDHGVGRAAVDPANRGCRHDWVGAAAVEGAAGGSGKVST